MPKVKTGTETETEYGRSGSVRSGPVQKAIFGFLVGPDRTGPTTELAKKLRLTTGTNVVSSARSDLGPVRSGRLLIDHVYPYTNVNSMVRDKTNKIKDLNVNMFSFFLP